MEDKTYGKIINNWNDFIGCLPDDDKQLLLKIRRKCYYKYQKDLKVPSASDYELSNGFLMSILIDQQIQIDELKYK
jgi:hypothetical protein